MKILVLAVIIATSACAPSSKKEPPTSTPTTVALDSAFPHNTAKQENKKFSRATPPKLRINVIKFPLGCAANGFFPGIAENTGPSIPNNALHFLMDGQSNMAGQEILRPTDSGTIPSVWLRGYQVDYPMKYVKQWESAVEPLNRYTTYRGPEDKAGFGPMQSFARRVHEVTGQDVALIADAQPSTKIAGFMDGTTVAKDRLARYAGVRVDAIIWAQGESDVADTAYLAKLKTLIAQRRALFKAPCMPFIVDEILPGEPRCKNGQVPNYGKVINDQLAQLPSQVPYTAVSSSAGLHAYPGCDIHPDHDSYVEKGVRMANVFLCLTGRLTNQTICGGPPGHP